MRNSGERRHKAVHRLQKDLLTHSRANGVVSGAQQRVRGEQRLHAPAPFEHVTHRQRAGEQVQRQR
jgi:hypothetical protein